jgi:glycosyltransferase involved in cell wall biosynthesis
MKILFDATIFEHPFPGIAKATLYLYEACSKIDTSLQFEGFIENKLSAALPDKYSITKLSKSLFHKQYSAKSINRIIDKSHPDILHFPWNGKIPGGLRNGEKIMTLHDVVQLEIPRFFSRRFEWRHKYRKWINIYYLQKSLNRSDIVFTDSEYSKKQILKYFDMKIEPVVLYLGPTINLLQEKNINIRLPKSSYFMYVGGYVPRKNIKRILQAILELYRTKNFENKLLIFGKYQFIDTETESLLKECIECNIVEQLGYVSDADLGYYYKHSMGLLYLSKYEGFGLPPLEAMSLGCPVITTKYSSLPEVCGDAVVYVEPDNISEVSHAIYSLASNKELQIKLKIDGIIQAKKFSWEKSAKLFLEKINS